MFSLTDAQHNGEKNRNDSRAIVSSGVISLSTSLKTSGMFERPVVITLQLTNQVGLNTDEFH